MSGLTLASDAFEGWRGSVMSGSAPVLFPVGEGDIGRIEIGPGRVLLIGGAPGAGKTAFIMQTVIDALRLTPTLRAIVCNVEMSVLTLLDRQLSRLAGVPLDVVRSRQFGPEHLPRIQSGFATLESLSSRLAFVNSPYTLSNVTRCAEDFQAELIVLDYIQRITPGDGVDRDSVRGSVDASMNVIRQIADADRAAVVVSAVSRGKGKNGKSSYDADALNLASFRESSELEFGADDAYILAPSDLGLTTLRHLKARHSETRDVTLRFDGSLQRFTSMPAAAPTQKPMLVPTPVTPTPVTPNAKTNSNTSAVRKVGVRW